MKTLLFKYTLMLMLTVPGLMMAHNGELKGKHTKEKTIKKEFNVNSDALLKVSNSYGNLNITSWNENRVVIEVHVKTNGNNEEKVQKKLDNITIDFEASSSMVSAKTNFNNKKSSWGWGGKSNNVNMQINYTIKLPVKNSVHLSNDYGNINLDRIDGHAKISCDYGRLDIGELHGRNNQLSFDYTSKSTIGYINSGKISADYSGFTIEKAGNLEVSADYTNSTIEKMENLEYSADYGNLEVEEVENVNGNGDYINVKLGTVHGNVDVNADYGSVRIKRMASDAGNINLRTDYTGIKIGYDSQYHFDFEITTEHAGVSGKDAFEMSISKEKSSDRYYKGYYGKSGSGNKVYITSDYGSVSFSQY
ncbi:hypothetical protein [Muriicola sp. Z0-33]|uniref:hypothetical protein n=1 Tax=Muriicola sp. Z0-33 TaxID=2816957 RepID=UPI00223712A9|nr:hypothetical protein [Muriicola sp. Z0-33]MCW5517490.1 hypothetical protein [Muriicola sp. Z0-33]